jgi:cell division protein FtsQ
VQSVAAGALGEEGEPSFPASISRKLVLPRLLRRPARLLFHKEWKLPRYLGLKAMAALFVGTAVAGMLIGGHTMTVVSAVTAWSGLAIQKIEITGQSETSEVDIIHALGIGPFPSLVTFDVDAGRTGIAALPWVKQATIKKLYPDTLQIAVVERQPFAIWQHDDKLALIDRDGAVITDNIGEDYAKLPFVVGDGAAPRAAEYAELIGGVPSLKPRIHAGVLVAGRRWNIVLDNGVQLLLPEQDPGAALVAVAALDGENGLLSRAVAAVDLRLADKLVVRLTEEGAAQRKAILDQRDKLLKKGKANT